MYGFCARRGLHLDRLALDLGDQLLSGGGLPRLGLVRRESLHELLQLADALLGAGVRGHLPGPRLRRRQHVVVVVARVDAHLAVVQVGHVGADRVQEVPVVRDDDHRRLALVQHALEPANRVDVEVVGRLVQQQHVRVREQRLRQQNAQLQPGRHLAHRRRVQLARDSYAQQQLAGARLRGVAVVLGELRLEVGRAHVVLFGRVGVGVDRVALGHRLPHLAVADHHHVEHAQVLEGELVLAQLAQSLVRVEHHVARARLEVAAEDLHERRLAGTVRADQAVAVAVAELDGDVLEQGLGPELHRDVGGGQHR